MNAFVKSRILDRVRKMIRTTVKQNCPTTQSSESKTEGRTVIFMRRTQGTIRFVSKGFFLFKFRLLPATALHHLLFSFAPCACMQSINAASKCHKPTKMTRLGLWCDDHKPKYSPPRKKMNNLYTKELESSTRPLQLSSRREDPKKIELLRHLQPRHDTKPPPTHLQGILQHHHPYPQVRPYPNDQCPSSNDLPWTLVCGFAHGPAS
jgi:hypothetical protein